MKKRTKRSDMTPELAADIVTMETLWEVEFQLKRLETVPDDDPLTADQRRRHAEIVISLSAALDAAAQNPRSGDVVEGLEHVAFSVKLLADELGAPRAPFAFEVGTAIH